MPRGAIVSRLLESQDPAVRYKARVHILGENPRAKAVRELGAAIATSPRALALLSERDAKAEVPYPPYAKWYGAHWVLVALAELDYPKGDRTLIPLRDQVLRWLFSDDYARLIRYVKGIVRIHASIDGNALWALHMLGLADERAEQLAARLVETQWADGGWNCDVRAGGQVSSFTESLIPLRALALHAHASGNPLAKRAGERAAEVFLRRRLYKRLKTGRVIHPHFVRLRYPRYWHYDFLFGLKVMAESGHIGDPRCRDALDLLESYELADGGWAADGKYYQKTRRRIPVGRSLVGWGPAGKRTMNEFVTVDALQVLRAAGRQPSRFDVLARKHNGRA